VNTAVFSGSFQLSAVDCPRKEGTATRSRAAGSAAFLWKQIGGNTYETTNEENTVSCAVLCVGALAGCTSNSSDDDSSGTTNDTTANDTTNDSSTTDDTADDTAADDSTADDSTTDDTVSDDTTADGADDSETTNA